MYFIDYAITVVPFPPLYSLFPSTLHTHCHAHSTALSSCPWFVHISSLTSPFPTLFLTSPCLFSTYHLCYLFSVPFLPLFPLPLPADNTPCDLHFCDSVPVLVVCLVFFFFFFRFIFSSCEFVVILLFIVLIVIFLDKSL